MKHIVLLRHGQAVPHHSLPMDYDRPLTEVGKQEVADTVRQLCVLHQGAFHLVSSGAKRAKETALIAAKVLEVATIDIVFTDALYAASAKTYLQLVGAAPDDYDTLLFVAHNPTISLMTGVLSGDERDLATAGIAWVSFDVDNWAAVMPETGIWKAFLEPAKDLT